MYPCNKMFYASCRALYTYIETEQHHATCTRFT